MNTEQTATQEWHVSGTGNHQGLIIGEDGRNVAVAYDKADAPLLAAAPDLVRALEEIIESGVLVYLPGGELEDRARAALAKATANP